MIVLLLQLFCGQAHASTETAPWPQAPATVPGECPDSVPLTAGQKVPSLLVEGSGLVRCSSVCEPLSSYAHLLKIEQHAKRLDRLYQLDMQTIAADRDYWRMKAEQNNALHKQPWFVAVTTSILVSGMFVAYSYGSGN